MRSIYLAKLNGVILTHILLNKNQQQRLESAMTLFFFSLYLQILLWKGEDYMKTIKNKLCALGLIGVGILSIILLQDATMLMFVLPISIGLFFATKNYV